MRELVDAFPAQLREALEISSRYDFRALSGNIKNVVLSGLGGSGIGASLIAELTKRECPVPVYVNKDYFCPAFVDSQTLFVACSYSGNTEETLASVNEAEKKGARMVAVTSGGKLGKLFREKGYGLIEIPGGMPPRSCIGYSLGQLYHIFSQAGLISGVYKTQWIQAAETLEKEGESIRKEAEVFAEAIYDTFPIFYSESGYESLAVRICQQLSENAKMVCSNRAIPEMNHNELVGWRKKHPYTSVVFIETGFEFSRNAVRMQFTREVVSQYTDKVFTLKSKGAGPLESVLYLIHLTDIASCILAENGGYDPSEIDVIIKLKNILDQLA